MEKSFAQFVTDLKDPATFNEWGPALALLKIGNFEGLVTFGKQKGYAFKAADVKAYLDASSSSSHAYLRAWASSVRNS